LFDIFILKSYSTEIGRAFISGLVTGKP